MTIPLWQVLEIADDPGTGQQIGLDSYPIFDEAERESINRLIIDHFWLRDIGQETISIFTFMLRRTMREIMPTYNQLYLSSRLAFDPLSTYDLATVRDGTATDNTAQSSSSNTGSNGSAKSRSVYFDTPQTALSRNKDYAANATDAESTSENTGTSTGTGTAATNSSSNDTSRTTGRQGSGNRLLAEFRANIINTDIMLLNDPELTSMFMQVWNDSTIEPPHRYQLGAF